MRFIQQQAEPRSFQEWKQANITSPQNLHYGNVSSDVREAIKEALRIEQGGLCGYTMKRMTSNSICHIEHIEAQSPEPEKTLDYANMLACIPFNGGDVHLGYGAAFKGDKTAASPHHEQIEHLFVYSNDGLIKAAGNESLIATQSITNLNLNHLSLKEERLNTFAAFGLPIRGDRISKKPTKPLSASQAKTLAKNILKPNAKGELAPFCLAISQVAQRYAAQIEQAAQRRKGIRT